MLRLLRLIIPGLALTAANLVAGTPLPPVESGWDYSDPVQSETRFRKLVRKGEAAADAVYVSEANTQLARALGMQQRFAEADAVLDTTERSVTSDMTRVRVRLLLERGRVRNSSGEAERAVPLFEQAFALAKTAGHDYLLVDAAHMLGIAAAGDAAIAWHERAIALAETVADERARRWLGPLYNNLAWTYNDLGRHAEALALFEKDIAFRESLDQPLQASIARWSRAKTLRLLGRVDEALAAHMALIDHPLRKGKPAEGYTHEEIGECLLLLGRADEAPPHFAIAAKLLAADAWLVANEPLRLERLRRLASGD